MTEITHAVFTQVRAAARRKTLLLLWWIDGGMSVAMHGTLARQGLPRGRSDYAPLVAWVHRLSNLITPPTSAMCLLLWIKGSPQWQSGHYPLI